MTLSLSASRRGYQDKTATSRFVRVLLQNPSVYGFFFEEVPFSELSLRSADPQQAVGKAARIESVLGSRRGADPPCPVDR